jgi:hypothetical protein
MRIVIAAATVASVSLVLAGVLGVASAEAPAVAPVRTVSVQGVATEPIEQSATTASATAVYRQGMTDAIGDAQTKALFLASKVGATVGQVQSMAEGGGYIECAGNDEYLGEQPDFGSAGNVISAGAVAPRATVRSVPAVPKPAVKRRKPKRKGAAKKAAVAACTLSTQVSLVYALS